MSRDPLLFGLVAVLGVLLDLFAGVVGVEEAVYALFTTPAAALHTAFVRSARTTSTAFDGAMPLVATVSIVVGLSLLLQWIWERA